jgi:hypothetical protein
MFKMALLAASAAAMVALPSSAEARRYGDYYGDRYYGGYGNGYYGDRYYGGRHGGRYYGDRYYGRRYGGRHYGSRYYRRHRCNSGTGGLIVGGAVGALVGREIDRSNSRYRYSNGTTGAIVGGAVGALVGREVARDC